MEHTNLSKSVIILGFFDGIHCGHRKVIGSAVKYANENNLKTILLTLTESPAKYFGKSVNYIYERNYNYKIIKQLGVDEIKEFNFSDLVNISAADYLKSIASEYSPAAIFTGFNYSFGAKRYGSPEYLEQHQEIYDYKYYCIEPVVFEEDIISSTLIKEYLSAGNLERANIFLKSPFSITAEVIKGSQIGRTMGSPTANMNYPDEIIKLPFGVYKAEALGKTAVLNWGIRPTLNGNKPVLEVHILDFIGDLYGEILTVTIIKKLRDEKQFNSLEELKTQINKDIEECLK